MGQTWSRLRLPWRSSRNATVPSETDATVARVRRNSIKLARSATKGVMEVVEHGSNTAGRLARSATMGVIEVVEHGSSAAIEAVTTVSKTLSHLVWDDTAETEIALLQDQKRQRSRVLRELGDTTLLASQHIGSDVAELIGKVGSKEELIAMLREDRNAETVATRLWPSVERIAKMSARCSRSRVQEQDEDEDEDDIDDEEDSATAAFSNAVVALDMLEAGSQDWHTQRAKLAALMRQGNTYVTWSIALRDTCVRDTPLLYSAADADGAPSVTPAAIGGTCALPARIIVPLTRQLAIHRPRRTARAASDDASDARAS